MEGTIHAYTLVLFRIDLMLAASTRQLGCELGCNDALWQKAGQLKAVGIGTFIPKVPWRNDLRTQTPFSVAQRLALSYAHYFGSSLSMGEVGSTFCKGRFRTVRV